MKKIKPIIGMLIALGCISFSSLASASSKSSSSPSPAFSYQFNTSDFISYQAFKSKYMNVNLVLHKCSIVDTDLTSEKQFNCLQKMNTQLTNANALLFSKLDKYDKSDYSTGIDLGFKKAMQGCDKAFPAHLQNRFKNQIFSCKLRLQIERLNFIAYRSLPHSS